MTKVIAAVGLALLLGVSVAEDAPGTTPKTGSFSGRNILSATFKALPIGERLHVIYEGTGVSIGDTAGGLFHNASIRCIGALHAVNGRFDDESGACVYTRPDGNRIFTTYRSAGTVGSEARGPGVITGGTGKLKGIQGSYEAVRTYLRPAEAGTKQSVTVAKGTYRLP